MIRIPQSLSLSWSNNTHSHFFPTEALEAKEFTEKSDVYCFGLILIELLTGKSPPDAESCSTHGSIVNWARYCYSHRHLNSWVDPTIKGPALSDQNEIVEAMNLALHCTSADPAARPSADMVVKTLESIQRTGSCVSGLGFPCRNV